MSCVVPCKGSKGSWFEDAALIEPMAVALHGVRKPEASGGSSVLAYGMGTVGLFAVQWARIFGAGKLL